jgi:hypothetical protein
MPANRFINRDVGIDKRVRTIVESAYPDVLQVDRASVNRAIASQGTEIQGYEGTGADKKEKIVWGVSRMGGKRVVTI